MNLAQIKQKAEKDKVSASLVFKECVHMTVLDYFFKKGLFADIVFQGGTALRLVYGGLRYSEDLDFVLKKRGAGIFSNMESLLRSLPLHVKKLNPIITQAQLKIQKTSPTFQRYSLVIQTEFLSATDKTNIEIANIPSYKVETVILRHPDIPLSPAICVESAEEIFSDKLLAFCARDYLKGRDLWDIHFMNKTLKITPNSRIYKMLGKKIRDYGLDQKNFYQEYSRKLKLLKKNGGVILQEEMDRFLPVAYRAMFSPQYTDINKEILTILKKIPEKADK